MVIKLNAHIVMIILYVHIKHLLFATEAKQSSRFEKVEL